MFIHEVSGKVGLSRKSIRFYEEQGLLNPTRNSLNDYREYSFLEVKKLKIIKFLRELGVSVQDLKDLNSNLKTLNEILEERIIKIKEEEKKYDKIKNICEEIIEREEKFETLEVNSYFKEISILNKEGFTMREIESHKGKKIVGAIFSSFIFSVFFLFIVGCISYFQFTEVEKMPWILYYFILFLFLIPIIGILYNLVLRIKEIKKGEEDEASKY